MSHRRKSTPSYLPHKQSGRARAVWTDALGVRQQKLLPGPFDSPESRTAFAKLHLELAAAPLPGCQTAPTTISVNEVLLAHLDHAERHYRRADGSMTHEVDEYRLICRYVRELYGTTPAAEFGPLALKAVRQKFIDVGWCRSLINQRIGRVKRVFKWAASEQLIPVGVHQALATVQGLQKGRSQVRESKPVEPVADAFELDGIVRWRWSRIVVDRVCRLSTAWARLVTKDLRTVLLLIATETNRSAGGVVRGLPATPCQHPGVRIYPQGPHGAERDVPYCWGRRYRRTPPSAWARAR